MHGSVVQRPILYYAAAGLIAAILAHLSVRWFWNYYDVFALVFASVTYGFLGVFISMLFGEKYAQKKYFPVLALGVGLLCGAYSMLIGWWHPLQRLLGM